MQYNSHHPEKMILPFFFLTRFCHSGDTAKIHFVNTCVSGSLQKKATFFLEKKTGCQFKSQMKRRQKLDLL
jgi:hypothetical protein